MRPDELIVLENAAKTIDLVAKLDLAMADQPLVVPGSQGQLREHPLLSEQRQQRALLARLLAQLKLPESDELDAFRGQQRQDSARSAARARWGTG